jgi:plastocyanin
MVPVDAEQQGVPLRCISEEMTCSLLAMSIPMGARARRSALVAIAVLPLALGACGGGDDSGSSTPTAPADATLTVEALNLKFDKKDYTAAGGDEIIAYLGLDSQHHTLAVLDSDKQQVGTEAAVDKGETDTIELTLDPGEYTLICTVPGHAAAGMQATLTVS